MAGSLLRERRFESRRVACGRRAAAGFHAIGRSLVHCHHPTKNGCYAGF